MQEEVKDIIEGNSMEENEVEDENVYEVDRVVDERKRKVMHVYNN